MESVKFMDIQRMWRPTLMAGIVKPLEKVRQSFHGIIFRIVKSFQGDILNENSVTTTVRHFPGGGARSKGHDPHFEEGQFNIYPTEGSLKRYHIPPFRAAIEADTTSSCLIMLTLLIKVQIKDCLHLVQISNLKKLVLP